MFLWAISSSICHYNSPFYFSSGYYRLLEHIQDILFLSPLDLLKFYATSENSENNQYNFNNNINNNNNNNLLVISYIYTVPIFIHTMFDTIKRFDC
jgi:hypothetical protein